MRASCAANAGWIAEFDRRWPVRRAGRILQAEKCELPQGCGARQAQGLEAEGSTPFARSVAAERSMASAA